MEYELVDLSKNELPKRKYVIYGAGKAGKLLFHYLSDVKGENVCCCDSNIMLVNRSAAPKVILPEEAAKEDDVFFLIGFMDDDSDKHHSAIDTLNGVGVANGRMIHVSMNDYIESCVFANDLKRFIEKNPPEEPKRLTNIFGICFLAHAFIKENEARPTGGPIGAEIMQKRLLGQHFNGIKLYFPYFNPIRVYFNTDKFFVFVDAIMQAKQLAENVDDMVYVANDVFCAYGLYLAGAKYILVFHAQGDFIKERMYWGSFVSDEEYKLLTDIERKAFENAYKVFFPSKGAEQYFIKDTEESFNYKSGLPLYNSIYEYPEPAQCGALVKDDTKLTFLSVGQMTDLKGIDRIPAFLKRVADLSGKKIRWICVADGPLKEKVKDSVDHVFGNGGIEYINIDFKIPHEEIFGLMKIADIYIMLQRVSIFDFSTLEAMYCGKAVILSDIPGNDEFNAENNILLCDENVSDQAIRDLLDNIEDYGVRNKEVYKRYFGGESFIERYHKCLKDFCDAVESE